MIGKKKFQQFLFNLRIVLGTLKYRKSGFSWRWIYAQCVVESTWDSNLWVKGNNPFGMHEVKVRKTTQSGTMDSAEGKVATYSNGWSAASDYLLWLDHNKFENFVKLFDGASDKMTLFQYAAWIKEKGYFGGEFQPYIDLWASKGMEAADALFNPLVTVVIVVVLIIAIIGLLIWNKQKARAKAKKARSAKRRKTMRNRQRKPQYAMS